MADYAPSSPQKDNRINLVFPRSLTKLFGFMKSKTIDLIESESKMVISRVGESGKEGEVLRS